MKKHNKEWWIRAAYILVCFALLVVGAVTNLPAKLSSGTSGTSHLDWWSNDLLIADLMYNQNYDNDEWELHYMYPPTVQELTGQDNVEWIQADMFRNNETFAREDFITYYSNIVAQRYVYAALDKLLPVSNGVLLRALYLLNELLVSAAALLFLLWLEKHTVPGMALFGAVMLGLFGMVYDAMAANLYWVEWSMFAPPLALAFLLESRRFAAYADEKKRLHAVFWATFAGCAVKQLMYFEFITTAMIAATIPVFVYLAEHRRKLADWLRWYGTMIGGAVLSFVVTFGAKSAMVIADRGWQGAWNATLDNLLSRVSGLAKLLNMTDSIGNVDTREAVNVGVGTVLGRVFGKTALLFNAAHGITVGRVMLALAVLAVLVVVLYKLHLVTSKSCLWAGVAWYAMLAPLSWYFMAKEHTLLHSTYTLTAWYVPAAFVAVAAFACCVVELVYGIKGKMK